MDESFDVLPAERITADLIPDNLKQLSIDGGSMAVSWLTY